MKLIAITVILIAAIGLLITVADFLPSFGGGAAHEETQRVEILAQTKVALARIRQESDAEAGRRFQENILLFALVAGGMLLVFAVIIGCCAVAYAILRRASAAPEPIYIQGRTGLSAIPYEGERPHYYIAVEKQEGAR